MVTTQKYNWEDVISSYIAQVDHVLRLLQAPYSDEHSLKDNTDEQSSDIDSTIGKYFCRPPITALGLSVTWSS